MAGVNAFGVLGATMDGDTLLGVTDGSTRAPGASQHALNGEPVRLQQSDFVQVTAGGNVVVSDLLIPTNEGKVIAYTGSSATCLLQAIQAGTDGSVIWCKKIGAFGIGGGVSPVTGGNWPDTSKALWQCEFTGAIPRLTQTPTSAAFAPGPDYYHQTLSHTAGVVEMSSSPIINHFGVIDLTNLQFDSPQNWIVVGNAPPSNYQTASISGKTAASFQSGSHEFVTIWLPASTFMVDPGNAWEVFAGCWTSNGSYPLNNSGAANKSVCFLFVASNASPNWICRARFFGSRPAELPVDYDYNTGIPHNLSTSPSWCHMKISVVPGSGATPYPTIEYRLNGTLVHSFNVNTGVSAPATPSQVYSDSFFAVAGTNVAAGTGTRWITCQIDYQHSLSTFANENRILPS